MIIAAPGMTQGKSTTSLISTVDLYPTLCDLAGITPPEGPSGRSLVPVLRDPAASVQDAVFHVYPRRVQDDLLVGRAVRTSRWRYVEWQSFRDGSVRARELYDTDLDPDELRNVADQPDLAPVRSGLAARIAALGPAKPPVKKNPDLIEPAEAR